MSKTVRGEKIEYQGRTYTFLEATRKGIRVLNDKGRIEHLQTVAEK